MRVRVNKLLYLHTSYTKRGFQEAVFRSTMLLQRGCLHGVNNNNQCKSKPQKNERFVNYLGGLLPVNTACYVI